MKKALWNSKALQTTDRTGLHRDLQFLARIDLVRVVQYIAIVVPNGFPLDPVFLSDLRQIVA